MNDMSHLPEETNARARRRKRIGDRIVQVALLLLIAGGIAMIMRTLSPSAGAAPTGGRFPGGAPPRGAMPGRPGRMAGSGAAAPAGVSAKPVSVTTVSRATVEETIRVNGDVETTTSVSIYPDAGGKIVEHAVSVGDAVRVGSTIAVVDPSIPGQRYEMSGVLSTIRGTVTAIHAQVGATVSTQTPVATVGDLQDLEITTFVPERFVDAIRTGLVAGVTFEAFPGESFEARVVEISPVLDAASRTVEVTLVPVTPDGRIKVGMFASIKLVTRDARDVVTVPTEAITSYYDDEIVYVLNESGDAVERRVITRGLASSSLVQVTAGVVEGEQVVIAGLSSITDGASVRVVE